MYTPDRNIVNKLQLYDSELFVKWNNNPRAKYFELWRKKAVGEVLITPITESAYDPNKPRVFTPLDERILWWIYEADSWRYGGGKKQALDYDKRWLTWHKNLKRRQKSNNRDMAKDMWNLGRYNYVTKYAKKNGKPRFDGSKPRTKWTVPDLGSSMSTRLRSRSKVNAKAYNYQGD